MDPRPTPQAEAYRARVRAFLAQHLPPDWKGIGALEAPDAERFTLWWRSVLAEAGFLAPGWPTEYGGGGLSALEQVVLAEELQAAGVPSGTMSDGFSITMLGNTLLRWSSEEQKRYFLPRVLSGEIVFCQGYSEPDAGSDLAGLSTRAVLDGDEWAIHGRKTWTSEAHRANWIFLLARTDPDQPRHRGLSFLLCPLAQPGIEIRPIRNMAGDSTFNEVFFDGARTASTNVVGGAGNGWNVAMTLLGYERGASSATMPIMFRTEVDRLIALARERGVTGDPIVRQRLAFAFSKVEIMRYMGLRTLTGFLQGQPPGPEASLSKLYWSEYHQWVTNLAVHLLGADALVPSGKPPTLHYLCDEPGAPNSSASWVSTFLSSRAETIYAGTSQIQRNIAAELTLGLPR